MSTFWSAWIIVITLLTYVGLALLIWTNRAAKSRGQNVMMSHEADGIGECDAPTPLWFTLMFVALMVFGAGYLIAYPGLGNFPGLLGWTQHNQLEREQARAQARYQPIFNKYGAMSVEELQQEPQALKMGQRLFANHCAQCHGSDAGGAYGFPDLTDDEWIWGGSPEQLRTSINAGRTAVMPGWESALGDRGLREVTAYVIQLSGRDADPELAQAGAQHYAMYCQSCHGAEGKGNQDQGASDLTNDTWLYGGSFAQILHTVRKGRQGQMPAHEDKLSGDEIQLLTAYVYSLATR